MRIPNNPSIFMNPMLWFLLAVTVLVSSCDTLEPDAIENQEKVTLSNDPIVLTPKNSGVIDLNSLVKSSTGNHTFSVTRQPVLGDLEPIDKFLLRYTPHEDVTEGKDSFVVSVFGGGNIVVGSDTIIIIITPDTTDVPCGLYTIDDYVTIPDSLNAIDISVVDNDFLCGVDSSLVQVSLLADEVSAPNSVGALYGSAQVLPDGRIRYTPGAGFPGQDQFMYRITKPANVPNVGDPEQTSIGTVYITSAPDCPQAFIVLNDTFSVSFDQIVYVDSVTLDTMFNRGPHILPVAANDFWCSKDFGMIDIVIQPQGDAIVPNDSIWIEYTFPAQVWPGFEDFIRYRLCAGGHCEEADVTVRVE